MGFGVSQTWISILKPLLCNLGQVAYLTLGFLILKWEYYRSFPSILNIN